MYVGKKLEFFSTRKPSKLRAKYKNWTKCQTEQLVMSFNAKAYPDKEEIQWLAKSFNTSERRIGTWFSQMRCKKIAEGMLIESE